MMHIAEANVVLFGLDDSLTRELRQALQRCSHGCATQSLDSSFYTLSVLGEQPVDLVFCGPDLETVRTLRKACPGASIIVVSRVPEVMDWLDAMEAGADDYCAPPFETSHLHWILINNIRPASMAA